MGIEANNTRRTAPASILHLSQATPRSASSVRFRPSFYSEHAVCHGTLWSWWGTSVHSKRFASQIWTCTFIGVICSERRTRLRVIVRNLAQRVHLQRARKLKNSEINNFKRWINTRIIGKENDQIKNQQKENTNE